MFNFLTISRRLKIIGLIILIVTLIFIYKKSWNLRLTEIYAYHTAVAHILDLEMQYMLNKEVFDYENDEHWIPTGNLEGHIFSAYLDARPEVILENSQSWNEIIWAEIRIIAILALNTNPNDIECVFRFESNDGNFIYQRRFASQVKAVNEHWDLKYSAFFIVCQLARSKNSNFESIHNEQQLPRSVGISLYESINTTLINFVDIHYPKNGMKQFYDQPEKFMALCVPVLHHQFDYPLELIEFVEYYKLMGVNHFTFYNASVSSDVSRVLQYYQEIDIATVLTWNLPSMYIYEQTLRHEGLFAALNDCLYRNIFFNSYKYIANFDFDEFLVPRKHKNFTELMNYLDPQLSVKQDSDVASFLFRNVYFYTMYPDEQISPKEIYLYTKAKIRRLKEPHPPRKRSRYIVRARDVIELGNYQTWQLRQGSSTSQTKQFYEVAVEPDVALSHHYAPCEAEETGCYLKSIVIDRTAQKFANRLSIYVSNSCDIIFGQMKCPLTKKRMPGNNYFV